MIVVRITPCFANASPAEPGPEPRHLHYETATQESDAVAQMIREQVEQGAWALSDVAVLVRSNGDADQFLQFLLLCLSVPCAPIR